jgi:hypothetical protein
MYYAKSYASAPTVIASASGTWQQVAAKCNATAGCVAFSSKGQLISALNSVPSVEKGKDNDKGKDKDACTGTWALDSRAWGTNPQARWLGLPMDSRRSVRMDSEGRASDASFKAFRRRVKQIRDGLSGAAAGNSAAVDATALFAGASPAEISQLQVGLAVPDSWDSRLTSVTGGFNWVTPVRDQGMPPPCPCPAG